MSLRETALGIVNTARICVPTVFESAFGPIDPTTAEQRLSWWAERVVNDAEVDLTVRGREYAGDGSEPLVVMSNHQSFYDIPVIYRAVPGRIRMVAKAELFKVPVFGQAMLAAGFIRIERENRDKAIETLRENGKALLAKGTRVWIAPEGTRSKTGTLGPFKSGGFRMALEMNVRILPVSIDGTRHVLPAKGVVVKRGQKVNVTIFPPIDPKTYGVENRKKLINEVRRLIESGLGRSASANESN